MHRWSLFTFMTNLKPIKIIVVVCLIAAIGLFFWDWWDGVSPQNTFWGTISNNLKTRSLNLQTTISADLPDQEQALILQQSQLNLNFAPRVFSDLNQKTLIYDEDLNEYQEDSLSRLQEYKSADLTDLPQQEWYTQNVRTSKDLIYVQHDLTTQPPVDSWTDYFSTGQETIPWNQDWYRKDLSHLSPAHLQHFLMTSVATQNGVFYGYLPQQLQHKLFEHLQKAYVVDWSKTKTVWRDDRWLYEYEVSLDRANFGQAFLTYFNAHLPVDNQLAFSFEESQNIFNEKSSPYIFSIDVLSRQIVEVRYPLKVQEQQIVAYNQIADREFILVPHFSLLINSLGLTSNLDLQIVSRVTAQNQRQTFDRPPRAFILKSDD